MILETEDSQMTGGEAIRSKFQESEDTGSSSPDLFAFSSIPSFRRAVHFLQG